MKKNVEKVEKQDVVIIGRQENKLSDIFDLSEKEWAAIAKECELTEKSAKSVEQLALGFGVKNGGPVALRGYFFGRAIAEMEMRKGMLEALGGLAKALGGDKGDEDGN